MGEEGLVSLGSEESLGDEVFMNENGEMLRLRFSQPELDIAFGDELYI